MKFLVVLFAVVAVCTCKPHQPAAAQSSGQVFQVQVQSAPAQQHHAPPAPPPPPVCYSI